MKREPLDNNGFTLVEILIVLAIILIILRYVFAREILQIEKDFFSKIGIDYIWVRVSVGLLIVIGVWSKYKNDKLKNPKRKLQELKYKIE
jgi:prepilin-type N-terminal cleavage/methylation domain-containing protein